MLPARAELYRQGESCAHYFVLQSGWIALQVMLEAGSWHIADFALPGILLGMQPVSGLAMSHSAICLTDVVVCPLPRTQLDALAATHAALGLQLARITACREERVQDAFVNVSGRAARERLAHLLVTVFYRIRRRLPERVGETVIFPVSLAQMGEAVNLTEVHVSRTLGILRDQGIVHFIRHKLEILNPAALLRAAGFEGEALPIEDKSAAAAGNAARVAV